MLTKLREIRAEHMLDNKELASFVMNENDATRLLHDLKEFVHLGGMMSEADVNIAIRLAERCDYSKVCELLDGSMLFGIPVSINITAEDL